MTKNNAKITDNQTPVQITVIYCPQCGSDLNTYTPNLDDLEVTCIDCGHVFDLDDQIAASGEIKSYTKGDINGSSRE